MDLEKLNKYDKAYLRIASEWSKLSYCERKKVGAIIVKDKMIISDGYNGTPTKFENACEDPEGLTLWYVLHAEANAILKVAHSTQSCEGSTLYISLSPCRECRKLIHQAGIKRVVYQNGYRDTSGIEFLSKAGVEVGIRIASLRLPSATFPKKGCSRFSPAYPQRLAHRSSPCS